jgi:hypothetical protein
MKMFPIVAIMLLLAAGAAAQAPNGVSVIMPNGNSFFQSTATSGTLSGGGATCTWSTQDGHATVTFTGSYTTSWMHPSFNMYWFDTSTIIPMALDVTSSGSGAYGFSLPYNTGAWNYAANETGLVGDWAFGHYIPASSRFDCDAELAAQSTSWDVTFTFNWGEGVAAEASTWGAVKSLYR